MHSNRFLSLFLLCIGIVLFASVTFAHSLEDVEQAFEGFPGEIPPDLVEATRTFNSSAGANSIREQAHESQHQLIQAHLRALAHRKCSEVAASLPELDEQILRQRDQRQKSEEERLRTLRDLAQTFLSTHCRSPQ
jgi:hypothetical protein